MALKFDPETPLAGEIRVVENALIVPWGEGKRRKMAALPGSSTRMESFVSMQ
ncbi:MAG: hypothetical protein KBT65_11035 [Sulfitobacter sp.]|nr:hypothetical protein [Sulfitobacter sp.]